MVETSWLYKSPQRAISDPVILYFQSRRSSRLFDEVQWVFGSSKTWSAMHMSVITVDASRCSIVEAASAYEKVCKASTRVILSGDAIGGRMAVDLLDKIHQQSLRAPFGVALISPWVQKRIGHIRYFDHSPEWDNLITESVPMIELNDIDFDLSIRTPMFWRDRLPTNSKCVWGDSQLFQSICQGFSKVSYLQQEDPLFFFIFNHTLQNL